MGPARATPLAPRLRPGLHACVLQAAAAPTLPAALACLDAGVQLADKLQAKGRLVAEARLLLQVARGDAFAAAKVRKTPCRPRSWANFSLL